jgi:hypothetical protein
VQRGKAMSVGLKLSGQLTVDSAASRYLLSSPVFVLQLRGAALPAAGLPVELRFERIEADLAAQTLEMPGMDMQVAGARLTGALSGTRIVDAPHIGERCTLRMSPCASSSRISTSPCPPRAMPPHSGASDLKDSWRRTAIRSCSMG